MIERLAEEVLVDEYFLSLYLKANKLLANVVFQENNHDSYLTEKELKDILRFSDILSHAKNPEARNRAYSIITLLNNSYNDNPYYKTFSHSVLAKLGNFPGIEYLIQRNNNLAELPYEREIEKTVKEFIQAVPDTEGLVFTDSQFELYKRISGAKHFSFSGPTSMGKSFIIKSFIRKAISNSPPENIVIMVPTRALINQFSLDLNKELKELLDYYHYRVITNSNVSDVPSEKLHQYLFVLTPERLLSYLAQKNNPPIGYLFVDEAHKMAAEKDSRAITAYNAIAKTIKNFPNVNLYFASPNVANPEVFLQLFKKDVKKSFRTIESPVSQNLFFINLINKNVTHYTDIKSYEFQPDSIKQSTSVLDILKAIGRSENNIVYCSSKQQAVEKALQLFNYYSNENVEVSRNVKKAISQIKAYIHKDYYLAEVLSKGIGYHFGNLPQIIRNKIESLFKSSELNFVFCTSTLLEGVNLPAKNVFVLNNKNGINPLLPIDFWNLAGRAGRLRFELAGNIFCVKESEKDWKNISLLEKDAKIFITPSIESHIDKELKKIEAFIKETPDIKVKTETLREILAYIANIITIDTLEIERANYVSVIIKKLIDDNREDIIALAKEKTKGIEVPIAVLNSNQSVSATIQNEVFQRIKSAANDPSVRLPNEINYENCRHWLHFLHDIFHWDVQEKKHFKSKAQLDYYAMLMNQWVNGIPLSSIINQSIEFYDSKGREIKVGFKPEDRERFNRNNKRHVNILIGDIIDDIEFILRFLLEKYFNNYYIILVEVLGESKAGSNWATFLEYGTRNSIVIALQNYGLSRHSANYLYTKHRSSLKIENDKLIDIDLPRLKILLDKADIEYDEINSILF